VENGLGVVGALAAVGGAAAVHPHQPPLLVGAAVVIPLGDARAVGGGPLPHLQGLAAVAVDQADVPAVGVEQAELLVPPVEVGPRDDVRPAFGRVLVDVEHLAAVLGAQPVVAAAGVDEPPLLPGAVVAGPLHDRRAVVGGQVVHVQRLAAVPVDQHVPGGGVDGGRVRGRARDEGDAGGGEDQRGQGGEQAAEAAPPTGAGFGVHGRHSSLGWTRYALSKIIRLSPLARGVNQRAACPPVTCPGPRNFHSAGRAQQD